MGSTKGSVVRGLKESGGTVIDPVRPRLIGLFVALIVVFAVDCSVISAICRTVSLEIWLIVETQIWI